MGIAESIGVIIGFVICVALVAIVAYGAWIGVVWLYDKVVKIANFIYEIRGLIIAFLVFVIFSVIRSFFDSVE